MTLVDAGEWPVAVAAASLMAQPVSAPLLVTEDGDVPSLTESAVARARPPGLAGDGRRQAFVLGDAAEPDGLETLAVGGTDAAEAAAEIARLRERSADEPDHIVVDSLRGRCVRDARGGWAARSGDPVLFVAAPDPAGDDRGAAPQRRCPRLRARARVGRQRRDDEADRAHRPEVQRVGDEDPVSNAVEFARFADGSFGWNINDPGHGFVITNTERPLDAAIASPLSASGTWGPLPLTDDPRVGPAGLAARLPARLKPGYVRTTRRAPSTTTCGSRRTRGAIERGLAGPGGRAAEIAPIAGSGTGEVGSPQTDRIEPEPRAEPETKPMSESRRPDRLLAARSPSRTSARSSGPATPHFALQIRNRIRRLVAPLARRSSRPRVEAEREIPRLEDLARHSGEPRGLGPRAYSVGRD